MARQDEASAAGGGPEMRLTANGCTAECTFATDEKFTLVVEIVEGPGSPYVGAQTFIEFGPNLRYDLAAVSAGDEIQWTDCSASLALHSQPNQSSEAVAHGCLTGLLPLSPPSSYVGPYVQISLTCSSASTTTEIRLVPNGDPLAPTFGTAFVLTDNVTQVVPKVGTLSVTCGEGPPADTPAPATDTPVPLTATPVPPTATPGLSCHPLEGCGAKIGIESLSLAVGESGSLDVTALMSPPASTWVVDVIYDRDIITFTDCEAFNFAVCNHRFAPNAGTIAGASLQGISGNLRLGSFRVECLAPGTSNLDVVLTLLADTTIGAPQPMRALVVDGKVSCEVPAVAVDFLAASLGAERTTEIRATGILSPGLAAWIIHLQYDPSLITPTNCAPTSNGACNTAFSALAIRVNGAASPGLTGDFLIASITFECKRLGVGTLELTLEQFVDATVGDPRRIYADTHNASVSCSDVVAGDANCNGTVDPIDASLILQFSSGLLDALPCGDRADVSGDGVTNPLDAALILQFSAGLISSLPP